MEAIRTINDEEGGLNMVSLTFRGEDPEVLDAALDELADELAELDNVRFAVHDLDDDLVTHVGLLQLAPEDVNELNVRLKGALALGPMQGVWGV